MSVVTGTTAGVRIRLMVCSIAIVFLAAACDGADGKLDAVRALAQSAAAAEPMFSAIAGDFYASCVRQYNWERGAGETTDPLEQWCGARKLPAKSSGEGEAPAAARDATQLWQKTNAVFLSYIRALGGLAGGQANDYGIPVFKDNILALAEKTKNPIDKTTATAVSNLAQWMVDSHFARVRKDELAKVVTADADAKLRELVESLTKVATMRYGDQLWAEGEALDTFYKTYLPLTPSCPDPSKPCPDPARPRPPLSQPLLVVDVLSYRQQWMRDRQVLAARYAAIDAYVDALDKLAKGHSALVTLFKASKPPAPAAGARLLAEFNRDLAALSRTYGLIGETK